MRQDVASRTGSRYLVFTANLFQSDEFFFPRLRQFLRPALRKLPLKSTPEYTVATAQCI